MGVSYLAGVRLVAWVPRKAGLFPSYVILKTQLIRKLTP